MAIHVPTDTERRSTVVHHVLEVTRVRRVKTLPDLSVPDRPDVGRVVRHDDRGPVNRRREGVDDRCLIPGVNASEVLEG